MTKIIFALSCFFSFNLFAASGDVKTPEPKILAECTEVIGPNTTFDIYNEEGRITNYRLISRDPNNSCGFPMYFVVWPGQDSRQRYEPRIDVIDVPVDDLNEVLKDNPEQIKIHLGHSIVRIGCSKSDRYKWRRGAITKSVRDARGGSISFDLNSIPVNEQNKIGPLHDRIKAALKSKFDDPDGKNSLGDKNSEWVRQRADKLYQSCDAYLTVDQKLELNKFRTIRSQVSEINTSR